MYSQVNILFGNVQKVRSNGDDCGVVYKNVIEIDRSACGTKSDEMVLKFLSATGVGGNSLCIASLKRGAPCNTDSYLVRTRKVYKQQLFIQLQVKTHSRPSNIFR